MITIRAEQLKDAHDQILDGAKDRDQLEAQLTELENGDLNLKVEATDTHLQFRDDQDQIRLRLPIHSYFPSKDVAVAFVQQASANA